jgi:hypothetical protein
MVTTIVLKKRTRSVVGPTNKTKNHGANTNLEDVSAVEGMTEEDVIVNVHVSTRGISWVNGQNGSFYNSLCPSSGSFHELCVHLN